MITLYHRKSHFLIMLSIARWIFTWMWSINLLITMSLLISYLICILPGKPDIASADLYSVKCKHLALQCFTTTLIVTFITFDTNRKHRCFNIWTKILCQIMVLCKYFDHQFIILTIYKFKIIFFETHKDRC